MPKDPSKKGNLRVKLEFFGFIRIRLDAMVISIRNYSMVRINKVLRV